MGQLLIVIAVLLAAFALGLLIGLLLARGRTARLEATLEAERKAATDKAGLLTQAETMLRDTFEALSARALKQNNENFLGQAKATLETFHNQSKGNLELHQKSVEGLLNPLKEQLQKLQVHSQEMEKNRNQAYGGLVEQVKNLALSQQKLESATSDLVAVLRQPQQRGRWGEVQLDNVLRAAGMLAGLDFVKQPSVSTPEGRFRPDVIVYLPDGGQIIIDAKAPVDAFLNAYEAGSQEEREAFLVDHVRLVRNHIASLSAKEYWSKFSPTPEWVVMFVPAESFLTTALLNEPGLIAESTAQRVMLASPITLIALLTAVASGWRQKRMEQRVEEIGRAGAELYDRLAGFADSFGDVGLRLNGAVDAFNKSVGSLQSRVLPSARRMKELEAPTTRELSEIRQLETRAREIEAPELRQNPPDSKEE